MSNFDFKCIELDVQKPTNSFGRFVFKPLEIGQGLTIGTVLRRVLLTNLPGLSIIGVRIGGVNDQFSLLSGVREDVLEILLNLKEIVFKEKQLSQEEVGQEEEKPRKLYFKIQGPAVVSASSFEVVSNLEIVNPHQYIATICDTSYLEMELILGWGQGYSLANNASLQNSSNFLQVDAIFMPVKKVVCHVVPHLQTNFNNSLKDHEHLVLDIWTNGSISPHEAVCSAAKMIGEWFNFLEVKNPSLLKKEKENKEKEKKGKEKEIAKIPIEELHLSKRAFNGLKKVQVHFLGDLLEYSLKDLQQIKSFGQKSVQEVVDALKKYSKNLKE